MGAHARKLARPDGPRRVAGDGGLKARPGQRQRVRGARVRVAVGLATMSDAWSTP
jgi:hypothetical protein